MKLSYTSNQIQEPIVHSNPTLGTLYIRVKKSYSNYDIRCVRFKTLWLVQGGSVPSNMEEMKVKVL